MGRIYAYLVMFALVGATAAPLLRHPGRDGFPLSTYPMFSDRRTSATMHVGRVQAVLDDGARVVVPPHHVANSEVLQTDVAIQRAIRAGRRAAIALCKRVIRRLPSYAPRSLVAVEIITATYDAVAYFEGKTAPKRTVTHARCWPERRR